MIPGRGTSAADATRTIATALAVAALSQGLRLTRALPAVCFLASLSAVLALRRVFADRRTPQTEAASAPRPRTRSRFWSGALLAAMGSAGAAACSIALYDDFEGRLFPVLVAGPLSLAALGAGADLLAGYDLRPQIPSAADGSTALLLAILAVGALFRFGSLGSFPPPDGFSSIEEMQRATGGAAILRGQRPWEFPLAQYLAAASFALFGKSFLTLRLPATTLAWLTLPLFYLLARRLVDRPAALFATALLAVSRWHVQIGWYDEDVYVPLFPFVALLYLLVRTRDEPRPSLYVAAGALCGYMLYDYAAYRGAAVVALAFFATDALWQRRWPRDWRRIALLFAVTLLFVLPLRGVLERGRGKAFYVEALERSLAETRYYSPDPVAFVRLRLQRINDAADAFTTSDHRHFFPTLNLPYAPLLDPFTAVFFTLGFGTATLMVRRRRPYGFFTLAFLGLASGAMVVTWNLDSRRLAVLVPFVFLFAAFVAQEVDAQALDGGWRRCWHRVLSLAAAAALLWNGAFLFLLFAPDPIVRAEHRTPYTVAGFYLQEHYAGEYVLLLSRDAPNFFESNDYDWMKPAGLRGRVARGVEEVLVPDPPTPPRRDVLLLVTRPFEIRTVLSQVLDLHPGSTCEFRADPDHPRHDLGVCRVPHRLPRGE